MKILFIGGTRFIGLAAVEKLAQQGHKVIVFHRGESMADLSKGVDEIFGDREQLHEYKPEFGKLKPDVVVDMMLLYERNARDLVKTMSGITERLVVISSCDVYQNYNLLRGEEKSRIVPGRIKEDGQLRKKLYPYRKITEDKDHRLYDYDKITVEKAVMDDSKLPATVLRLPMVYGPRDYQYRFYDYYRRMLDKRPAIILDKAQADWRITRGFSEDCGTAIALAAVNNRAAGNIYNVGEPEALTERDWINIMADICGWDGELITLSKDRLPDHLKSDMHWEYHLDVDTSKIRKELDYIENASREEVLEITLEWLKANPPVEIYFEPQYVAEDKILQNI
jgi:nucleoside-diphosphate-sugar epimerase